MAYANSADQDQRAQNENFSANKYEKANLLAFSNLLAEETSCSAELN